jgi:magnesium-transporting ATPase (P-type)
MALTIGSTRMAKKNVIVKKLNAVESLGSCTVIASDKTGTLTVNEQTAKKIIIPDGSEFDITGNGYNANGKIVPINNSILDKAIEISRLGLINNEATFTNKAAIGDSIDIAFLALADKANCKMDNINKLGIISYESENKYSAVFYKNENKNFCTIKGSLEKILEFCDHMDQNNKIVKLDKELIIKQNEKLASQGYRVIALADGKIKDFKEKDIYDNSDISGLVFKGLVGFIDPIREETISSIEDCKKAGIKVVMVTGDHPLTAFEVARQLSIATNYNNVATSEDIDKYMNQGEIIFDNYIKHKTVFARVSPMQKLEIINSYKRQNEFIAVTGDGVNDAPAIKAANIGIAMGSGTDVAKETASMIIADDNFLSIVAGVKEGRNAYNNIRKIVYYLVSCGLAEVIFFLLAILFNMPMPLAAIQLLWLNVVTDGFQDLALSFEKEKTEIMKHKPRSTKESLFDRLLITEIAVSGIVISVIVFIVWYILINIVKMDTSYARGYIMALMVFIQNLHVLNCRSEHKSIISYMLKGNPFVIFSIASSILLQIIVMEVEPLSRLLSTHKVPYNNLIILLVMACPIILSMEIFKLIRKTKTKSA